MPGQTKVETEVVRVVDGDTVRVRVGDGEESLRLLALDTEESRPVMGKPFTPFGTKAKEEAVRFFPVGQQVTLEFPGDEPEEVCWRKYRGNYGRPLVFIHKGNIDYQEHMIREGYSPYFVKYGYVPIGEHHKRYTAAERAAQEQRLGVWDQITNNGSEMRNYAVLAVWWHLRARIIDDYRAARETRPDLLNTRLDYEQIVGLAGNEGPAVVFTELRECRRVGGGHLIIRIGSEEQPFKVFVPDVDQPDRQPIVELLENRYVSGSPDHPRRSYAYVGGMLKLYRGEPEIVVTAADQITDVPPMT